MPKREKTKRRKPAKSRLYCDFCHEPPVVWFPAKDFHIEVAFGQSLNITGHWAACSQCKRLILKGDTTNLLARAITVNPTIVSANGALIRSLLRQKTASLFAQFVKHRTGEPYPIEKGQKP